MSCAAPALDEAPDLVDGCETEIKKLMKRVGAIRPQDSQVEFLGQVPQGGELSSENVDERTSLKRPRVEDGSDKDIQPPQKRGKV